MAADRVVIVTPVRDDWPSVSELLRRIDARLAGHDGPVAVLMVDDGSAQQCPRELFPSRFAKIESVLVLRLKRNLGHQRAIAVGLVYVLKNILCATVAVMDSDGEDTPEGLADLLAAYAAAGGGKAVFAARSRRTESFVFRCGYAVFKLLHFMLTGIPIRVGNFSVIPFEFLDALAVMPDLWNHFAATVFRSRLPYEAIPIPRGHRIAGVSKMNLVSLVTHGLSAISVFGDVIGTRMILLSLCGVGLSLAAVAGVAGVRFGTELAIPGWATTVGGILLVIATQLVTMAAVFTFFVLNNRMNLGSVPLRDYELFIAGRKDIYPGE